MDNSVRKEIETDISLAIFGGEKTSKDNWLIKTLPIANSVDLDDVAFLSSETIKPLIHEEPDRDKLNTLGNKYKEGDIESLVPAVLTCYRSAARFSLSKEDLTKDLAAIGIETARSALIVKLWEDNKERIIHLLKKQKTLPSLRAFNWSVDRRLANDELYEVLETSVFLSFTIRKGQSSDTFSFELSEQEFLAFYEEIKALSLLLEKKRIWEF